MVKTGLTLREELTEYGNPKAKMTRMLKSGELIKVKRGLYVEKENISLRGLSGMIYGPSYLSFEWALSAWGLIPEEVQLITAASFNKNKNKTYHTPLGRFTYYCIPSAAYPYGISLMEDESMSYLMASAEKALCDSIYRIPSVHTQKGIAELLVESLRIEREELTKLDLDFIDWIAPRYGRKSLRALSSWLKKGAVYEP